MIRLGYHVSIAGGISKSFDYSYEIGSTSMQIFLSSPRMWALEKASLDEKRKFLEKTNKFDINPIFVHMPYLPNIASPKQDIYEKSIKIMTEIIDECNTLSIPYVVAHLGSDLGTGKEKGIERVVSAINKIKKKNNGVSILLENQAGQKNSVGSDLNDLKKIFDSINTEEKGFCIDTCHLFAAGYDIRKKEILNEIKNILKFENIKLIHLNDAIYDLGSKRDRHEFIGKGTIGVEGFKKFFSYEGLNKMNFILETPRLNKDEELKELSLVRDLISN
ncbi:MAG: deoxyribonuclease IV [Candidatus Micrarchaeaceae archaeon]